MSKNKLTEYIWNVLSSVLYFLSCVVYQDFNLLGFYDEDKPHNWS